MKPSHSSNKKLPLPRGLFYQRGFLSAKDRAETLEWLSTLHPIWEQRFSQHNPPPEGEEQRWLLRPVYWLGNWQFACLDYYHPPKGILNRCVKAEPYPPVLARLVARIEERVRIMFRSEPDLPKDWHLNTCLVNFYGSQVQPDGKRVDTARVGEHRDYEPGPVASLSLGERAMFQFVSSHGRGTREGVVFQQWLEDSALQIFGGEKWKKQLFHRVQRVEKKSAALLPPSIKEFETRRVNFTFRYVPTEHVVPYSKLSEGAAADVRGYMEQLAQNSPFFAAELA